ncbi:MAG: hypothetical protein U1E62_05550 [Alsobacter sp.]
MRYALGSILLLLASQPAWSHDPYTGLKSPSGQLCCGIDDCEVIEDFAVRADGGATFFSRRYQKWVTADPYQIVWISVPGGAAHWCGRPYTAGENYIAGLLTYCAFINPGSI